MDTQIVMKRDKKRLSLWKRIALGIGGGIVLCAICAIGAFAFALWGGGGEPANLGVAIRVDQAFVQAIHDQHYEEAYTMLSEVFAPQISVDQFTGLIHRDDRIFSTFERLDVCDWGFFISNGRVIDSSGLLYYQDRAIVVQISLHKDSDKVWRIQGFGFKSDVSPVPFGLCK